MNLFKVALNCTLSKSWIGWILSTCHNTQGDLVVEDLLGDFSIQTIVKSEPRPTVAPDQLEISKTSFFLLDLDSSEPLVEASRAGLRSPLQAQDNFDFC